MPVEELHIGLNPDLLAIGEKVLDRLFCRSGKSLSRLFAIPHFRGIDAKQAQLAAVFQQQGIAIVDTLYGNSFSRAFEPTISIPGGIILK